MSGKPEILVWWNRGDERKVVVSANKRSCFGLADENIFNTRWQANQQWEMKDVWWNVREQDVQVRRTLLHFSAMVNLIGEYGGILGVPEGEYSFVAATMPGSQVMYRVFNDQFQSWTSMVLRNGQIEIVKLGQLHRGETIYVETTTLLYSGDKKREWAETNHRDWYYDPKQCVRYSLNIL